MRPAFFASRENSPAATRVDPALTSGSLGERATLGD
jgi:hypothetical protein